MPTKKAPQLKKAYENIPFLKSHAGRTLRILSEYLEPESRFYRHRVHNTIVFFGSARAVSMEEAEKIHVQALKNKRTDPQAVKAAERKIKLARYYEDARELAHRLTEWSRLLPKEDNYYICNGGGPGIMEAASRGSTEAGGENIGFNISLPFEQHPNPYITEKFQFEFHYFFMRKFWFLYLAKAIIAFPGGFGTMDEMYEALTLLQTQKLQKKMVIVLYGKKFWEENFNLDSMLDWGAISPEDRDLFYVADSVDEAFNAIIHGLKKNGQPV